MGLVGRNSFVSVLVLQLLVLQGPTTVMIATAERTLPFTATLLVDITNRLPNGAPFTIHCKSKDDDLGVHVIGPGQKSEIKFNLNIFHTTLFFCGVTWQGGHIVFDIYDAGRDIDRCPEYCRWEARGDAVVGFSSSKPDPDIVIPWKK